MKIKFDNARVADFSESENKSNGILQMHVLEVIIIYGFVSIPTFLPTPVYSSYCSTYRYHNHL